MPSETRYCSHCAAPIERRDIEGVERNVCPKCGRIFYENPLPVAASVILNDRREVLLVKRKHDPHAGSWCLPMGFAETGETIAAAALRELKEEAGIDARPLRLLNADSHHSDKYGDLLIVTFEMTKTGGTETAGDDAAEAKYFPLSGLPQLAFSSNERALRLCTDAHLEEWMIHDSFERLKADESKVMLSDNLLEMIETGAEKVAGKWLAELRTNPTTDIYRTIDSKVLARRVETALSQFGRWLKGDEAYQEVVDFYYSIGRERREQGFSAPAALSALMLLKKHVWSHVLAHATCERPVDAYRVLELSRRVAAFFDKTMYHMSRGFEACEEG